MAVATYQEIASGSGTPTTSLSTPIATSTTVAGGTDQMYVAMVGLRDGSDFRVDTMSGGGLSWLRVAHSQDTQTTLAAEWWWAYGSPGGAFNPQLDSFSVETGAPDTSLAAVSFHVVRIDGALNGAPVNNTWSNVGAIDSSTAAHTETVSNANSLIVSGVVTRAFTITGTDADYTQRGTGTAGAAGNTVTTYIHTRGSAPSVGTDSISHTLSGAADWHCGAVEVKEAVAVGATLRLLASTGVGV